MAKTMWSVFLVAALIGLCASVQASSTDTTNANPSYYEDVLPIVQENCQVCHRPTGLNSGGMIAPMSFMSYKETRPWAKSIARAVTSGYMPPWGASKEFHGVFANERSLTDDQIATLTRWARTGAAAGDASKAPPPLEFPGDGGWFIGTPDLVMEMPEEFEVKDDVEDLYVNLTVEIPVSEDRWVKAIEFKPGSDAVHHIIGYVIAPGESYSDGSRGHIGGIAPGNEPDTFPDGFGFLVKANSKFVFAMHYHKESGPGTAVLDRSEVGIKFYPQDETPSQVNIEAIGNMRFEIPPNHPNWQVGSARVFERPIKVHFLMPHMHLRGKAAKYVATYPDGTSETLLEVPQYDFNWQISYAFKEPRIFPAGTRLDIYLWYDNTADRGSANNFENDRAVSWGGPTTDEMDLGWLSFSYLDDESGEMPSAGGGR